MVESMKKNLSECWKDFPLLSQKINRRRICYLDSAATTLKPWPVIERISRFLSFETANVHRATYRLASQATENFENVRFLVKKFLNARSENEIIFTKGTTESINLVAQSLSYFYFNPGDTIVVTEMEHHSNWVPWQQVCLRNKLQFKVVSVTNQGQINEEELEQILAENNVKVFACSALSNVLGSGPQIKSLIQKIKQKSPQTLVFVDGAQAVTFMLIDVQEWNCDFLAFSGHKIFGPYGVGVLYAQQDLLFQMPPYQTGGGMVDLVTLEYTTFLEAPTKFEAGTPNIEGVIGLGASLDYFSQYSIQDVITHEIFLQQKLIEQLERFKDVIILNKEVKGPMVSLAFKGIHPSDISQLLSEQNIYVRSGHHCCQRLMKKFGISNSLRISFSLYNQESDVDRFMEAFKISYEMLGGR